jgi:hypothetical protein
MEAVVAEWRYDPGIYLEELRKTTKNKIRIADVSAEIRSEHLPRVRDRRVTA